MRNELDEQQAAVTKALIKEGHKQQDVAALFAVNQRAISQIVNGEVHRGVAPNHNHDIDPELVKTPKLELITWLEELTASRT